MKSQQSYRKFVASVKDPSLRKSLKIAGNKDGRISAKELERVIQSAVGDGEGISPYEENVLRKLLKLDHFLTIQARMKLLDLLDGLVRSNRRDVIVWDLQVSKERKGARLLTKYLRRRGHQVQLITARGVAAAVQEILAAAHGKKSIRSIRFFGHGSPGRQIVGGNRSAKDPRQVIQCVATKKGLQLSHRGHLSKLRSVIDFSVGRVELHGCHTGEGEAGTELLKRLARCINVPVLAGIKKQIGGSWQKNLVYEGPIKVATPGGKLHTIHQTSGSLK